MQPEKSIRSDCASTNLPGMEKFMKESAYYIVTPAGVQCCICPNNCILHEGKTGICRTHAAKDNKLVTIAYGNPCSVQIDPIEKKPLFHFLPGSRCLSLATAGCNLTCKNCQNWEISQRGPGQVSHYELFPAQVVEEAVNNRCESIAFTYTEPTVFFEYTLDTALIARSKGIKNLLVSNGYINEEPLRELAKTIDAANIDLKSFSEETYKNLFGGHLQPVLNTLKILKAEGVWLEITNLLIPGLTDEPGQITDMCEWLVSQGFADTPLHFSRFYPMHKLADTPATPVSTLEMARNIALNAGIRYVYIGNVNGTDAQHTICPACKKPVVERSGYSIISNNIKNGFCRFCHTAIAGVWE
jgi:pyruvate formate lyase activating enzyme